MGMGAHVEQVLKDVGELRGPDPLLAANEVPVLLRGVDLEKDLNRGTDRLPAGRVPRRPPSCARHHTYPAPSHTPRSMAALFLW